MKKLLSIIPLVWLTLLMASCTENEETDLSGFQEETFARWMAKYYPEAEKHESGIYIEWLERSGSGKKLQEGYWMKLGYTGRDDRGDYYVSRSADIARQLGYFSYTTDYVPEFMQYSVSDMLYYSTVPLGQLLGMQMMEEGDSLRIFLPSGYGYTYSYQTPSDYSSSTPMGNVYGPKGLTLGVGTTLILDMRLNEIIRDAPQYEREKVEQYAMEHLDITDLRDSIALGVYLKKTELNPQGDSITKDSTASVFYAGYFLNGFVFDTNVDSIAQKHNLTGKSSEAVDFQPYASGLREGFSDALVHMQRGEKARVVMVSAKAYGSSGHYDTSNSYFTKLNTPGTYIPPYTPLIFDIHILEKEDTDEDE